MLGTLVLAVALAPQSGPPERTSEPGTVTIGATPASPGQGVVVTASVESTHDTVFTVNDKKLRDFRQTTRDMRAFDVRVETAESGADMTRARARVSYRECLSILSDSTGESRMPLPTDGDLYVVEPKPLASGAAPGDPPELVVHQLDRTTDEARAVPDDVGKQVARDASELLVGPRFGPLLSGKPLATGSAIDVPADLARTLLAGVLDGGQVQRFVITPMEPRATDVPFAAELTMTMTQGEDLPVSSTFELKGELAFGREHGRLTGLDLSGPIRFSGSKNGGSVKVTGTGTITWKYRAEPLPPAK